MLRAYFPYRYYIDTADLGVAITYSNPYLITRFEYWYMTNKFIDQPTIKMNLVAMLAWTVMVTYVMSW